MWLWYAGVLTLLWMMTGQTLSGMPVYVGSSLEVASGYVDNMLLPGGGAELSPFVVAFLLVSLVVLSHRSVGRYQLAPNLLVVLALSVVFYFTFRMAYVRFELMRALELAVTVGLMTGLAAAGFWNRRSGETRRLAIAAVAFLFVLVGAVVNVGVSPRESVRGFSSRILSAPEKKIGDLVDMARNPLQLEWRNREAVAEMRQRFPLSGLRGPIDMHGNSAAILLANGLEYSPRPVFQSFDAYTERLSRLNGDHVRGESGADLVAVELQPSLNFLEGFHDSHAWLELVQNFEPLSIIDGGFKRLPDGMLVAGRRKETRTPRLLEVDRGFARLGEIVEIPEAVIGKLIWAEIEVENSLAGKLGETFFKLPILHIQVFLESGNRWNFRFSSSGGRAGFLLSPQVRSVFELAGLMEGGLESAPANRRVVAFRLWQEDSWASDFVRERVRFRLFSVAPDSSVAASGIIGREVHPSRLERSRVRVDIHRRPAARMAIWRTPSLEAIDRERVLVTGEINRSSATATSTTFAVVIDGRIEGLTRSYMDRRKSERFAAEVAARTLAGFAGRLQLVLVDDDDPASPRFMSTRSGDVDYVLVRADSGAPVVESSEGERYSTGVGFLEGNVDLVEIDEDLIRIVGWSFDKSLLRTADAVLLFDGGRLIHVDDLGVWRDDLVTTLGPEAHDAGFSFQVPVTLVGTGFPAESTLVSILDDQLFELPLQATVPIHVAAPQ